MVVVRAAMPAILVVVVIAPNVHLHVVRKQLAESLIFAIELKRLRGVLLALESGVRLRVRCWLRATCDVRFFVGREHLHGVAMHFCPHFSRYTSGGGSLGQWWPPWRRRRLMCW